MEHYLVTLKYVRLGTLLVNIDGVVDMGDHSAWRILLDLLGTNVNACACWIVGEWGCEIDGDWLKGDPSFFLELKRWFSIP